MRHAFLLAAVTLFIGCAKSVEHDPALARRRALQFAEVALVKQDFARGYELLSDSAKRYVPFDKFKETVSRLHPKAYPRTVRATEYSPMPGGEKAIYVYLVGENSVERFYYVFTMDGSAATDYRVSRLNRATEAFVNSGDRQKFSNNF